MSSGDKLEEYLVKDDCYENCTVKSRRSFTHRLFQPRDFLVDFAKFQPIDRKLNVNKWSQLNPCVQSPVNEFNHYNPFKNTTSSALIVVQVTEFPARYGTHLISHYTRNRYNLTQGSQSRIDKILCGKVCLPTKASKMVGFVTSGLLSRPQR